MGSRWRFEIQRIEASDAIRLIYCRACRCGSQARWMRVRRWLKFAGIRFLPLPGLHRYLECAQCGEKYDMEILRLNPGSTAPPIDRQMLRVMIYAALADGLVDSAERKIIADLYTERFDLVLLHEQLQQEIEATGREAASLNLYMERFADLITLEEKLLAVELAFRVMLAGGSLKPGHLRQLHNLGNSLQIPAEQIDAVVSDVKSSIRQTPKA